MFKIKDIFYINQEHQITDEEIYRTTGNIPIYTAGNIIKGYGNNTLVDINELPCLTYQTKGFSGIITVQSEPFDANNTAALILKKEFKEQVSLDYVAMILKNILVEYTTADSGVSYLNKEIVQDIEIPFKLTEDNKFDLEYQLKFVELNKKIVNYKKKFENILKKINEIIEYELEIPKYKVYRMDEITNLNKGSNRISEEMIYKNYCISGYPVYSSATQKDGLMGRVTDECYNNIDKKGNRGELTWTTNGYAGKVFIRDTDFLYSEKCGRIVVKEKYKNSIDNKYLMIYLNQITYKYKTAESNNGKLDIIHMSNIPIKVPVDENDNIDLDTQRKIVSLYARIESQKEKINKILKKINLIIE